MNQAGLPENVYVQPASSRIKGYEFIFTEEDHTLGNLLQSYIDYNMMGSGSGVDFVGYKVPHPLRDEMVLCIGVEDGSDETAIKVLKNAAQGCLDMFTQWHKEWTRFMPREAYPQPIPVSKRTIQSSPVPTATQVQAPVPVETVKKTIMTADQARAEALRRARERAAAAKAQAQEQITGAP